MRRSMMRHMQVQWRLATKDLDDAQVGYEKKYADARAGSMVGFASERNFRLLVLAHAGNLIFGGFALNVIHSFLVLSLKTICSFIGFCPSGHFADAFDFCRT